MDIVFIVAALVLLAIVIGLRTRSHIRRNRPGPNGSPSNRHRFGHRAAAAGVLLGIGAGGG